jgi:hypothetical protein
MKALSSNSVSKFLFADRRGETVSGTALLQASFDRLTADQSSREFIIQSEMALTLRHAGRGEEGIRLLDKGGPSAKPASLKITE